MDDKEKPKLKAPPQSITLPSSLLQDTKKQDLLTVRKKYRGPKEIPADIGQNGVAALVFIGLLNCFKKARDVKEGELKDIIWGFVQCGNEDRAVAAGITALRGMGYLYYTDPLGNKISEHNYDPSKKIWVRYSPKFLNLLQEGD
jgi:hypothetical protein